ncbi:hypothetical protein AOA81_06605 [Methanomassiliicoccales archaeon RumEn M2]|nr:hypothetical protein AOA81_06605 [Methanomassiliicoccales archaeon RumEn M2]
MFCRSCGKEVDNNTKFCPHCGSKRIDMGSVAAEAQTESGMSLGATLLILAIVVILLGIGIKVFAGAAERGALLDTPLYDTSTIVVRVESTHILYAADYELFIDGDSIDKFRIGPGMYYEGTYKFGFLITEPDRNVVVRVVSTGGGLGMQTDSAIILIGTGANYNLTLMA